jgi:hypothetical protein
MGPWDQDYFGKICPFAAMYYSQSNGTMGPRLNWAAFLILWFYSCTHSYKNDKEMIVQNDSIGGHINIITGKYAGFFVPPPLPSYCYMYFGTELWFV